MSFKDQILSAPRPESVRNIQLPRRESYFPSPADWRDEVLYFLLPDRFSDGQEAGRPLVDRNNPAAARTSNFRFDRWAESGSERWQGGSIKGIESKLDYLRELGVTAIWVGPVFKQRAHLNTFHGYGIQDFLEVDQRFGTRKDLVDLVAAAHVKGLRVILDIVFNHTGCNWVYASGERKPAFRQFPGFYEKGPWFDRNGTLTPTISANATDTGIWPEELQADNYYTRAGTGGLGTGDLDDPRAEFRRTDFEDLRDVNFDGNEALDDLARCYKYWIALTDCDGFRLDTLKHVSQETGRNFCGNIREFASNLGKADFFLVGEVAGSDEDAARYREVLGRNLNATLDIGGIRRTLHGVAKGLIAPSAYLHFATTWDSELGSHRDAGERHVSILDDHDHVSGDKRRFSSDAASDHQIVAGVALQLFSLGIPCIYYGTEQALTGPEAAVRNFLPDFGNHDRYLRKAMFGPEHPRLSGTGGLANGPSSLDSSLPGFGPYGTAGSHCFDRNSTTYRRLRALLEARKKFPVLRVGRQYQRPISIFNQPFTQPGAGELITWSRILDDEEALCIVNGHGTDSRGGDVLVDTRLNNGLQFEVIANTAQAADPNYTGTHKVGSKLPVFYRGTTAFVEIRDVGPSEVLVLVNRL